MANVYVITLTNKKTKDARSIPILTGNMQDAMNIARARRTSDEEVTYAYLEAEDVVIDYAAVGSQQI